MLALGRLGRNLNSKKLLRWILRVHRYPRYFIDFYCNCILKLLHSRSGCKFGKDIWLHGAPIIQNCSDAEILIGDGSVLCSRSKNTALGVNHPVILRTMRPKARIVIGKNVRMSGASICAAVSVTIGDNVLLGANVVVCDTDFHSLDMNVRRTSSDLEAAAASPVEIGADVFVGANSAILKGVKIGKGAVIGFGTVVTKDIGAYSIAVGHGAKVVRGVSKYPKAEIPNLQ